MINTGDVLVTSHHHVEQKDKDCDRNSSIDLTAHILIDTTLEDGSEAVARSDIDINQRIGSDHSTH